MSSWSSEHELLFFRTCCFYICWILQLLPRRQAAKTLNYKLKAIITAHGDNCYHVTAHSRWQLISNWKGDNWNKASTEFNRHLISNGYQLNLKVFYNTFCWYQLSINCLSCLASNNLRIPTWFYVDIKSQQLNECKMLEKYLKGSISKIQ